MPKPAESNRIQELGKLVRARRAEVGYSSIGKAAEAAGVSVGTWGAIERGEGRKIAANYAAAERVLGWNSRACETYLDNGTRPNVRPGFRAPADTEPVVTELSSPGDRLMVVAAGWAAMSELDQRRILEIALAAHEKAHGDDEGHNRAAR